MERSWRCHDFSERFYLSFIAARTLRSRFYETPNSFLLCSELRDSSKRLGTLRFYLSFRFRWVCLLVRTGLRFLGSLEFVVSPIRISERWNIIFEYVLELCWAHGEISLLKHFEYLEILVRNNSYYSGFGEVYYVR